MAQSLVSFLLTRSTQESDNGLVYECWAASAGGPIRILIRNQESVCFVNADFEGETTARRVPRELQSLDATPVDALYYKSRRTQDADIARLRSAGAQIYESDIAPIDRFLMERFIRGGVEIRGGERSERNGYLEIIDPELVASDYKPNLSVASIDIETEGLSGALYSIAVVTPSEERVFIVSDYPVDDSVESLPDERALLRRFFAWLADADPDILIGWNVIDFDLAFLARRCKELNVPFTVGRAGATGRYIPARARTQIGIARIPGRVMLDGVATVRAAMMVFERYSLEHVARELLGRGKIVGERDDKLSEIQRMFAEDKQRLAEYNLEDCRLVAEIFDQQKLIDFAMERSRLTGLALGRQGGSVAAFDFRYLPLLHRKGRVAKDVGDGPGGLGSPGGYVLDSKPGLYDNVLVFDFKSLYPSIIRTFRIDPLAMALGGEGGVPGFKGAKFSRAESVLPDLITELHHAREQAKQERNDALSQAIKIMMNSFYGVLGTPGCRFYDSKLASSVTTRGHEIITRTRDFIEANGHRVIYGDTDSVFVHAGDDRSEEECMTFGRALAAELNAWWTDTIRDEHDLDSNLEIQFETLYLKFLMPTIRGSEKGTKKRYAGLVRKRDELRVTVRGLEAVRTDWTPLARRFQLELFRRVFLGEPCETYVQEIAAAVLGGELDEELHYRKRIRRPLKEYRDPGPPHVKAARKLSNPQRWISYAITLNGPEPVAALQSPLDYGHYLDRQLAPAADTVLAFLGTSFDALTARQMELFPSTGRSE